MLFRPALQAREQPVCLDLAPRSHTCVLHAGARELSLVSSLSAPSPPTPPHPHFPTAHRFQLCVPQLVCSPLDQRGGCLGVPNTSSEAREPARTARERVSPGSHPTLLGSPKTQDTHASDPHRDPPDRDRLDSPELVKEQWPLPAPEAAGGDPSG